MKNSVIYEKNLYKIIVYKGSCIQDLTLLINKKYRIIYVLQKLHIMFTENHLMFEEGGSLFLKYRNTEYIWFLCTPVCISLFPVDSNKNN